MSTDPNVNADLVRHIEPCRRCRGKVRIKGDNGLWLCGYCFTVDAHACRRGNNWTLDELRPAGGEDLVGLVLAPLADEERLADDFADVLALTPGDVSDHDQQGRVGFGGCADSEGHDSSVPRESTVTPALTDGDASAL